jgi:hypothetical protein
MADGSTLTVGGDTSMIDDTFVVSGDTLTSDGSTRMVGGGIMTIDCRQR